MSSARSASSRPRWVLFGVLAAWSWVSGGCFIGAQSWDAPMPPVSYAEEAKPADEKESSARLLSVHPSRLVRREGADGRGEVEIELVAVFSVELDPMSIEPERFGVVSASGQRRAPRTVSLSPASEADENRTLFLSLRLIEGDDAVALHIMKALESEKGVPIVASDVLIDEHQAPGRLLAIESLPTKRGRCEQFGAVLRTYWSDVLRGVDSGDLTGIEIRYADGTKGNPGSFADHRAYAPADSAETTEPPSAESQSPTPSLRPDDNVLDLCFDSPSIPMVVHVEKGLFEDAAGHATASATMKVDEREETVSDHAQR